MGGSEDFGMRQILSNREDIEFFTIKGFLLLRGARGWFRLFRHAGSIDQISGSDQAQSGGRRSEVGGRTGRTGWTRGAAPTELGSLWMPILQRCRTYGAWDFSSAVFIQA